MRLAEDVEFQRLRHALLSVVLLLAIGAGVLVLWNAFPEDAGRGAGEGQSQGGEVAGPAPVVADDEVLRLSAGDRFSTGAAAARALWPDGADTVVLATGFDYPDALAGGPLAAALRAPLLLTTTDDLPPDVREALIDLGPAEVVLMGGAGALSGALEQQIRDLPGEPSVTRVAGESRFETAQEAARRAGRSEQGDVAVATGFDFPDAVAAGALAAGEAPVPILLATGSELPIPLGADERVLLIGGPGALSEELEAAAGEQAGEVERLAGPERFATSQAVADLALQSRLTGTVPLVVATGESFPDALSAGAVAARAGGPLLLVPGGGPTEDQARWLDANSDRLSGIIIVGGPAAVSEQAGARLRALLSGSGF